MVHTPPNDHIYNVTHTDTSSLWFYFSWNLPRPELKRTWTSGSAHKRLLELAEASETTQLKAFVSELRTLRASTRSTCLSPGREGGGPSRHSCSPSPGILSPHQATSLHFLTIPTAKGLFFLKCRPNLLTYETCLI